MKPVGWLINQYISILVYYNIRGAVPVRLRTPPDFLKINFTIKLRIQPVFLNFPEKIWNSSDYYMGSQQVVSYVALQLVSCAADVKNSNI